MAGKRGKKQLRARRVHSSFTLSIPLDQKFEKLWKDAGYPNRNAAIEGLIRTWVLTQGYDHEFSLAVATDAPEMRDRIDQELAAINHSQEKTVLEEIVQKAAARLAQRSHIKKTIADIIRERASARHVAKKIADRGKWLSQLRERSFKSKKADIVREQKEERKKQ